jgi:hypothetical protein
VPSGPFKAEAFWNFQGKRGFANAGESCECEYGCSQHACARDIKLCARECVRVCAKRLLCSKEEGGESSSFSLVYTRAHAYASCLTKLVF